MAKDVRTIFIAATDDATQRAWIASFIAALTACGLVQTSDANQFLTASTNRTVGGTNAENTFQGYVMFRLSDTLQATAPVFIRFNFYVSWHYDNYNGYRTPGPPAIYMQVGRATDGNGNLVGVATNNLQVVSEHTILSTYSTNNNFNGTAYNTCAVWTCGDGSSIQVILGAQNTQQMYYGSSSGQFSAYGSWPGFLWVERTRNVDGTPNGNGVIVGTNGWPTYSAALPTGPLPSFQVLSLVNGSQVSAQETLWPITWPGGSAFSIASQGAELYLLPASVSSPRAEYAMGFMGCYKGDFGLGTQMSLTHLGAAHTYISLAGLSGNGNADNARSYVNTFVTNGALLMRWE